MFGRDRAAAVAVIFATMIVPICMLSALVIDYGFVLQAKSQLDLAADAAALAGARTAAAAYANGQKDANGNADYLAEGTTAATQWFNAQAGTVPHTTSFTPSVDIERTGQTFKATVSYKAVVYEAIGSIFHWVNPNTGHSDATIAGSSTGVIVVNAFGNVDFLVDNTSSMMLPADDTNLAILQTALQTWLTSTANQQRVINGARGLVGWNAATNGSVNITAPVANYTLAPPNQYCAFACHWAARSSATNQLDYYGVAKAHGERLRFDEVQSAAITAIDEMVTQEKTIGELGVGVYAFGGPSMTTPNYLTTIYGETPLDITTRGVTVKAAGANAAKAALATITPPISSDTPNTNIGAAIADMQAITGPSGNGNTAATPLRSLLLITDGVEDDAATQLIPSTEGPIDPAVCNSIKAAGYKVYILYTPYNSENVYLVNNIALQPYLTGAASPTVLSALQSCASNPENVVVATSPSEIQAGIVKLVDEAVGSTTRVSN